MYLNDSWSYLVELAGDPPLASLCVCLVDLSSDDDRSDVLPYIADDGTVNCTLGSRDGDKAVRRPITCVWEYRGMRPYKEKFQSFFPVSIIDFVRRVCDAAAFDGYETADIERLKREYKVL